MERKIVKAPPAAAAKRPRKRSKYINDLQKTISIFEDDALPAVDTELLKDLKLSDLYEDYKVSRDTEFTPFKFLPTETKEGFVNSLELWGNVFKDKGIECDDENSVLRVGDSHKHDLIPKQRFKKYFKKKIIDPEPTLYLDDRQSSHLYQLDRYDLWENFITPILFSKSRGKTKLQMSFRAFVETLQTEIGFDVFTYGFNRDRLLHAIIKLDASDMFYVCCIFTLIDVNSKLAEKFDQVINQNYSMKNNPKFYEQNHIAEMEIELQKYYYFTCGCEK